jgi:hypothetical protein
MTTRRVDQPGSASCGPTAGLSHRDLAAKTDGKCSPAYISLIEQGKAIPSDVMIKRLADGPQGPPRRLLHPRPRRGCRHDVPRPQAPPARSRRLLVLMVVPASLRGSTYQHACQYHVDRAL